MEGLFRGTWYRSAVKLEGDTIIPVPPFEPYNPFDWYYSASEVRQGERSLYLEFLSLDPENNEECLRFCERFGVLGMGGKLLQREVAERKVWEKEDSLDPNSFFVGLSSNEKSFLSSEVSNSLDQTSFPPNELCGPMQIKEIKGAQRHLNLLFSPPANFLSDLSEKERTIDLPQEVINQSFTHDRLRPKIAWNIQEGRWEFVWTSLTLTGYFFAMVMQDLMGPGKILTCPRCNKFFLTESNRVKYCSLSCYQNYKVQKYQKKKKEEKMAAQKRKKTKTTKSTGKKK